ncbi:VOC family protein [Aquiflexum sp.]|uniref:VOC family protein n=1 Tax=Aquiflexum sp. TaxID=1872584 RepID=UPI0035931434
MEAVTNFSIKKMSTQLLVNNLVQSIEFYTQKLEFDIEFRFLDFYVGIIKDAYSIHLKDGNPSTEERKNKRDHKHLDILFEVENIEELFQTLLDKNVDVVMPLRTVREGAKEFYIADPDGYIIGFLKNS